MHLKLSFKGLWGTLASLTWESWLFSLALVNFEFSGILSLQSPNGWSTNSLKTFNMPLFFFQCLHTTSRMSGCQQSVPKTWLRGKGRGITFEISATHPGEEAQFLVTLWNENWDRLHAVEWVSCLAHWSPKCNWPPLYCMKPAVSQISPFLTFFRHIFQIFVRVLKVSCQNGLLHLKVY